MIQWDHNAINSMVTTWANAHAARLDGFAHDQFVAGGGDIPTGVAWATPDNLTASVVAPYEGIVREYGTAVIEPVPWGIPALMEAGRG